MTKQELCEKVFTIAEMVYPDDGTLRGCFNLKRWFMVDAILKSYNYVYLRQDFHTLDKYLNELTEKLSCEDDRRAIQKLFEMEYDKSGNDKHKNLKRFKATCKSIAHGKYRVKKVEAELVMNRLLQGK